jgi:ubiquinone/menaquinone biosynthesis C-methylase UbiE
LGQSVYDYDRVARFYETIAAVYSLGAIPRVKSLQQREMGPGDRVLYLGVGAGEDALEAVRRGLNVTSVDASPAMLERLSRRLERESLDAVLIRADILEFAPDGVYQVVVANFVLNLFSQDVLDKVVARMGALLAHSGRLLVADVAPAPETRRLSWLYSVYYWPVAWAAWMLGLCDLHPIRDYEPIFEGHGLQLTNRRRARPCRLAPPLFESLTLVNRRGR